MTTRVRSGPLWVILLLFLPPLQGLLAPCQAAGTSASSASTIVYRRPDFASSVSTSSSTPTMRRATKSAPKNQILAATRGGGGDDTNAPKKKDVTETEQEAMDSIQFCYRSSLLAAVVGLVTTVVDEMEGEWSLEKVFTVMSTLHRFVMAFGLKKCWKIYNQDRKSPKRMSSDMVYEVSQTMSRLWRSSAITVIMGGMVLATSVKEEYTGSGAVFNWISANMLQRPGEAVLVVALLSYVPLRALASRDAKKIEVLGKPVARGGGLVTYATARAKGFEAGENMRLCMGAFAILGVTQLIVATFYKTGWVAIGLGLMDVFESGLIGGLLATLNRNFLKAVVMVTDGSDTKPDAYLGLYEAQKGFYSKIGKTFRSQAVFKILPYVVAGAKATVKAIKA